MGNMYLCKIGYRQVQKRSSSSELLGTVIELGSQVGLYFLGLSINVYYNYFNCLDENKLIYFKQSKIK